MSLRYFISRLRLLVSQQPSKLIICLAEEVIDLSRCEDRRCGSRIWVQFYRSLLFATKGTARRARLAEKTHRHPLMAPMVDMGVSCNMALDALTSNMRSGGYEGFMPLEYHGSFVLSPSTGAGGHWNFMLAIVWSDVCTCLSLRY